MNPRQAKVTSGGFLFSYIIMSVARFIDKEYFLAVMLLILAALMLFIQSPVFMKRSKEKEPPFNGIIIDEEKISVSYVYGQPKEILLEDIKTIQLNPPYNDTLVVTMKNKKAARVPLYWFAEEEQNRIKELLKNYIH